MNKTWLTFRTFGSILGNLQNLGRGGEACQVVRRSHHRADGAGRGGAGHLWRTHGTQGPWGCWGVCGTRPWSVCVGGGGSCYFLFFTVYHVSVMAFIIPYFS